LKDIHSKKKSFGKKTMSLSMGALKGYGSPSVMKKINAGDAYF